MKFNRQYLVGLQNFPMYEDLNILQQESIFFLFLLFLFVFNFVFRVYYSLHSAWKQHKSAFILWTLSKTLSYVYLLR